MKIHEYQAKAVLKKYGVAVPIGEVAYSGSEARDIARNLSKPPYVVKAQIHAGGRGKGGGVKLAKTPEEAEVIAEKMLGSTLVTVQTGPEGKVVKRVLVEEGLNIARELYLGMVIDRAVGMPVVMASTEGGVEIEKVAAESPEKILKEHVDPATGFRLYQARKLAYSLGFQGERVRKASQFMSALCHAFEGCDCSLAEINPLVETADGAVIALDAKLNFDDNALYRHKDLAELRDLDEEQPLEVEASKYELSYIKLDGNVGCMVNGAGLAMATMDLIKHAGGAPANFLDVGGGATEERVAKAFEILMSDRNVRAVLINIFGGIVRCDRVAGGIIKALQQVKVEVPVVIRLKGTNSETAADMFRNSGLRFEWADDFAEAAKKAVKAASAA